MGPSKTEPSGPFATALVSLGKSGRYQKPANFLWREESVHGGLVFIGYGMNRKCLKSIMATLYLKKKARKKMTGSIICPAGKIMKFKKN